MPSQKREAGSLPYNMDGPHSKQRTIFYEYDAKYPSNPK